MSLKRPHVKFDIGEKWNRTESVSSTMTKVEIAKDIRLQMLSGGVNSIKANLHTDQSMNYKYVSQFFIEFTPPEYQNIFHIMSSIKIYREIFF